MISSPAYYNAVMKALEEQRARVTASPEAALKFITDLGLLDILEAALSIHKDPVKNKTKKR